MTRKALGEASAISGMVVARFERMKWGLLSVMFFLPGCYTLADEARARAAYDLSCPSEQIETYHAVGGVTVARGCGAWTEYRCFMARGEPVCVREAAAQVHPSTEPSP